MLKILRGLICENQRNRWLKLSAIIYHLKLMQYISPFEELGIELDGNLDKNDLNLAKKRLLAELDLSESPTILRGSVELTKNDIINQFDKLAGVKNWDFHRLIAADKALLGFIKSKEWDEQKQLLKEPKYNDEAFVDFISPYFSESYKSLIIKHLTGRSPKNLAAVLNITPRLLTDSDHDMAWLSIEMFLEGWKESLNEIAENVRAGQQYADKELIPYQAKPFMQCLNLLPDDYKWFRDDYATSLFNLSAYSWNKEQHYRAMDIVSNARLLDISEDTAAMIDERIAWFKEQISRTSSNTSTDSEWSMWTILRVLFFAAVFIFRIATCENNTSKPTYYANPPSVQEVTADYFQEIVENQKFNKKYFEDALTKIEKRTTKEPSSIAMKQLLAASLLKKLNDLKEMPESQRNISLADIKKLTIRCRKLMPKKEEFMPSE